MNQEPDSLIRQFRSDAAVVTVDTLQALREALGTSRPVLVPTMGYLHGGHLSLLEAAREHERPVVLSIFVNPLQFGAGEDLDSYPRDLAADLEAASVHGVDVVFTPTVETMYPAGPPRVTVHPGPLGDVLCGAYRPGHFQGVLTVVAKLFNLVRPGVAIFGRKDFQQVVLIRRMVEDLNIDVEIAVAPIVREPDGLALSSRNVRLDPAARAEAVGLSRALAEAARLFDEGVRDSHVLIAAVRAVTDTYPGLELQYASVVSAVDLDPVSRPQPGDVVALAAYCGEVRLIDNVALGSGH